MKVALLFLDENKFLEGLSIYKIYEWPYASIPRVGDALDDTVIRFLLNICEEDKEAEFLTDQYPVALVEWTILEGELIPLIYLDGSTRTIEEKVSRIYDKLFPEQ